ncbi:MAG: serine/threonine protein kinase [Muribaculaceae bacterium]|nr:serine/threonine protein kinase [Muribaculaceae bacterium]
MVSETFRPVTPSFDVSGSYTDIVLLREGANMRLYRASKVGKYFAIKTTKDNLALQLAMLKREYELSIALDHYHLPHFYTFEPNLPMGPGIVMEYIDGRNLNEFLAENPSHDTRRRVFAQLLEVVAFIHKNGIVHNDLKPENILITKSNEDVKLLDFGLSNTDAHYLTKTMGCTRDYASPELLSQSDDIDARSDIYSLGKIMQLIFPRKYRSLSRKCLHENRDKRWDNVDQISRQWNKSRRLWKYVIIAVAVALMGLILTYKIGISHKAQQRELLDSLSIAREAMVKAQKDAAEAKQEATLAQQQLDSASVVQRRTEEEQKRIETERTAFINELKTALNNRFKLAYDSIKGIPYVDFSYQIMASYCRDLVKIKEQYLLKATDETTKALVVSTYDNCATINSNKINAMINPKSSIYSCIDSLSAEEFNFYHQLLNNHKPYRKYQP